MSTNKIIGYTRVSTNNKGQTVENQKLAIDSAGFRIDQYYDDDGVSGTIKAMQRPQFAAMMESLVEGDLLVTCAIDRLGRDAEDILNTLNTLERRKIRICVLQFGITEVTGAMGKMLSTIMSAVAECERNTIVLRTKQGLERTKAQGTLLGTPPKITPKDMEAMAVKRAAGVTLDSLAKEYGYNRCTIDTNLKRWDGKLEEYKKEYSARQEQYERAKLARA